MDKQSADGLWANIYFERAGGVSRHKSMQDENFCRQILS